MPAHAKASMYEPLWHFSSSHSIEETTYETGLHRNTVGTVFYIFRNMVTTFMLQLKADTKIGGVEKVVCRDVTYIFKKKRVKRGFHGVMNIRHKNCIFWAVELSSAEEGRRCTRNVALFRIEGENAATYKGSFAAHIHERTTVCTDGQR